MVILLQRLFFVWAMIWAAIVTVVVATGTVITMYLSSRPGAFRICSRIWGTGIMTGMGIFVRSTGTERVPKSGSYVFAINHQVALDIPAVGSVIPVPFGWVAKAELERVPFLGPAIRSSPSVFIDRSHPKKSVESMRRAGEKIRDGVSVAIFPEGSRSHSGDIGAFKRGAFLLAIEAQVPVIPVTIINAHEVFNEKKRIARPGVIRVEFGDPIDISGWDRKDIPRLVELVRGEMERVLGIEDTEHSPD